MQAETLRQSQKNNKTASKADKAIVYIGVMMPCNPI
jgi:hypothetical protein